MGTWGTGITSNDTFKDIYSEFIDQFNQGLKVSEIRLNAEKTYASLIADPDESNEFYFALAKAQWDCGSLEPSVFQAVKERIESGKEVSRWKNLGATESDLQKREKVLGDFLRQLSQPNPKPKKPKPIKLISAIFEQGDCLAIPLENGNYGAGLVLSAEKQTRFGLNLILAVDYFAVSKPTIQMILKSRCLNRHVQSMQPRPDLQYCYAKDFKKSKYAPEKIGEIQFKSAILPKNTPGSYGRWDSLADAIYYEKTHNTNESNALKISQFFKKSLFW